MGTFRMARINKQLQREISLMLEQRVKNDVARNAIITGVDCTKDLEHARVFFTTLDPSEREHVLAELRNVKGAIRGMLGHVLKLRCIPDLEFMLDSSLEYGQHIDALLDGLGLGRGKNETDGGDEDPDDDGE